MLPSKTSGAMNGLHLVQSLAKRVPYILLKHHILLSSLLITLPNFIVRSYCWKQYLLKLSYMKKSVLWPTRRFNSIDKCLSCCEVFCTTGGERQPSILSSYKSCCLQQRLAFKIYQYNSGTNVLGATKYFSPRFKAHAMVGHPYQTLLRWLRTWDYIGHGTRGKPTTIKWFLWHITTLVGQKIIQP